MMENMQQLVTKGGDKDAITPQNPVDNNLK